MALRTPWGGHGAMSLPCDTEQEPSIVPSANALWYNWRCLKAGYNPLAVRHARLMIEWTAAKHPDAVVRDTARGMMKFIGRYA